MKTQDDEMKKMIDDSYSDVKLPEGFEERLSAKIDSWAAAEAEKPSEGGSNEFKPVWKNRQFLIRTLSIAATLVLLVTGTVLIFSPHRQGDIQIADTCTSVEEAYQKTQDALSYISDAFGKGISKVNESTESVAKSTFLANKYITINE